MIPDEEPGKYIEEIASFINKIGCILEKCKSLK